MRERKEITTPYINFNKVDLPPDATRSFGRIRFILKLAAATIARETKFLDYNGELLTHAIDLLQQARNTVFASIALPYVN